MKGSIRGKQIYVYSKEGAIKILQNSDAFEFLLFEGFSDCPDYRRIGIQMIDTIGFLIFVK